MNTLRKRKKTIDIKEISINDVAPSKSVSIFPRFKSILFFLLFITLILIYSYYTKYYSSNSPLRPASANSTNAITPLMAFAYLGQLNRVKQTLNMLKTDPFQLNFTIDSVTTDGETAFHYALRGSFQQLEREFDKVGDHQKIIRLCSVLEPFCLLSIEFLLKMEPTLQ
jgi:hypothetical protein